MNTEETTDLTLTEEQGNAQVQEIAKASILNIEKNKALYEQLRDEYTGITLPDFKDPDFKKVVKKITEGSGKLVKARTAADKLVKQEVGLLKQVEVMIKNAGEDLKAITADTEKEVKALKETAEQIIEDDKQEQLRVQEERKQERISRLGAVGVFYKDGSFTIGELTISLIVLQQYSDTQFDGLIAQATVAYEAEQLRIAEERAAEERQAELARQEQEKQAEVYRIQQEELRKQNEAQQAQIAEQEAEKKAFIAERSEMREFQLRKLSFVLLELRRCWEYRDFIIHFDSIETFNKAEWDAKIADFNAYLERLSSSKLVEPILTGVNRIDRAGLKTLVLPYSNPIHTVPEAQDTIPSANPVEGNVFDQIDEQIAQMKAEEKVLVASCTMTFTHANPFIDAKVGKSAMRFYMEPFLDQASEGLTKESVAASGNITDELFFYVIKPKV